jgi:hypothetical protein
MKGFSAAVTLFCMQFFAFSQQEATIVASKDNTLYQDASGSLSNGAGAYLFAGKTNNGSIRRGLVYFNLSGSIPKNSTISSVTVKLTMSKTAAGATNVSLHKVLASWGEGTSNADANEGGGATATTDDATWVHRFFNTVNWTTQGGDFSSTPSATLSIGGVGSYQFVSTPELVADVQGWMNDSTTNNGWIIIGDESANQTAKRFDSRENASPAGRPTLIVQYTIVNSVHEDAQRPVVFLLRQNYPNPFNPATMISYSLPAAGHVSLKIFDLLGKEVTTLVNEMKQAGTFSYQWDASGLPSGIYFYRLQSGNNSAVKKLVLTR